MLPAVAASRHFGPITYITYQTPLVTGQGPVGQIIQFLNDSSSQFGIAFSSIGQVQIFRGNTLLATSVPNLTKQDSWHYVEMEYICNTTGGIANVYLDGILVVSYVGNTQNQTAPGVNGFQIIPNAFTQTTYIDDIYVISNSVRLGERRIETIRPDGDFSVTFTPSSGTSNFAMLDDTLVSSNDYTSATAVGSQDLFSFSNLSSIPATIDAIQVNVWATKTDVATRQLADVLVSGSQTVVGTPDNLPVNHTEISMIANQDPNGNVPWTAAAVNAIKAGYKIIL